MEQFKDIAGYEGLYKIDISGNVYSLITNKKLKTQISNSGYLCINLKKNGGQKNHFIHRLIMQTFATQPTGKDCINHIDGDKLNNSLSNLEWCDRSHNAQHAYTAGLRLPTKQPRLSASKLSKRVRQLTVTGSTICTWNCITEAEIATGTHHQDISKVCRGKRQTANGYKWKYV